MTEQGSTPLTTEDLVEIVIKDTVQAMVGCQWGRGIARPDDRTPCDAQAVEIVVLHDGLYETPFKLCARHRDIVLSESTPREAA